MVVTEVKEIIYLNNNNIPSKSPEMIKDKDFFANLKKTFVTGKSPVCVMFAPS